MMSRQVCDCTVVQGGCDEALAISNFTHSSQVDGAYFRLVVGRFENEYVQVYAARMHEVDLRFNEACIYWAGRQLLKKLRCRH